MLEKAWTVLNSVVVCISQISSQTLRRTRITEVCNETTGKHSLNCGMTYFVGIFARGRSGT